MNTPLTFPLTSTPPRHRAPGFFEAIAGDIHRRGYSIQCNVLPPALLESLHRHVSQLGPEHFHRAGIGRQQDHMLNRSVRKDHVCWITGETQPCRQWLDWACELRGALNRRLMLGLFSFESHFAHYTPGAFYKKHFDAFRGEANRVLSLVLYLNPGWCPEDGGELVLYPEGEEPVRVTPSLGTLAVFLSEEFPHEVLPAGRDRYSVAGWFRVNTTSERRADPPR